MPILMLVDIFLSNGVFRDDIKSLPDINAGQMWAEPMGTHFIEIWINIKTFPSWKFYFKNGVYKMAVILLGPQCAKLNISLLRNLNTVTFMSRLDNTVSIAVYISVDSTKISEIYLNSTSD